MSQNTIAAWLAAQNEPFSSPESSVIDYDNKHRSSTSSDGNKEIKAIDGDEVPTTGRAAAGAESAKSKQTRNESSSSVPRDGKTKAVTSRTRVAGTKRSALVDATLNAARSSANANATSKAPSALLKTTRKRKRTDTEITKCPHCKNKNKIIKCPSCNTKIDDLLSSSKPDASNTKPKVTRTEIPSTTQSTSQLISSPAHKSPKSTPPQPAKKRKTAGVAVEKEASEELISSQSTQYSPWRPLIPFGLQIAVRREW